MVVVLLILSSILLGAGFGARGLNAIAAPALVALIAAVVQVKRFDRPRVDREHPPRAHRGETFTVRLHFSTATPFSARVHDTVDEHLVASGNDQETTVRDRTIRYEVEARTRGEHGFGPITITARDVLGLVTDTYRYETTDTVLVRPNVHLLAGPRREDLVWLYGGRGDERGEFDQLRYYERGDPVRDIHWKSSAKQPDEDLVVLEFTAEEGSNAVQLAAAARPGHGDEMADAAASIAVYLLNIGVRVGVVTPEGRIDPGEGNSQRERVLDHLARASTGDISDRDRRLSQVVVWASPDGVSISLEGREVPFVDLAGRTLKDGTGGQTRPSEATVP